MFPELTRDDVFRLETRRLWLRWPRMADASAILRQAGEKAVAEMTASIPHPYPADAVEPFIFAMRKGNALGEHLALAITPRSRPNELIGMIGAHKQATGIPFIGYWLGTPHWGKGYTTEAAQALIDTLFTLLDIPAIEADTRVINPASRRVLEKSGFRQEGSFLKSLPARGGLFPCEQYRLDRSTWAALKSWGSTGWTHAPEIETPGEFCVA
ncbi:GCN5-related N-acetyltransferase [Bosea sp. LC85]|uniref:GNAT family N-acetyltransferase n=1 Tax=Bosea sp. LC85 TaxID=1502851 RepID=UPI0004E4071A|nr:GNAT family N-acetyltransferase [Bosea sp. LC85]KFC63644.1 GCN5-related N-acetyltransferase [Bosea sp. LC85]